MANQAWQPVLDHIRTLAARPSAQAGDAELLSRFIQRHDEAAFESLLHRHGPLVLRVARRVLGSETDAEDVFQAAFLLLARRAGSIRKREAVASWLHGVAHRLALSARAKNLRRQQRERQAAATRCAETPAAAAWSELEATLHQLLTQLPAKYRTPLVYCYLEGWTQEEAAHALGVPLGTLRSWVARGRELLRKRLLRRGITLSAEGASAALLASACAPAEAVPPSLFVSTSNAARLFAAGGKLMTLVSPPVAALVRRGTMVLLAAKVQSGVVWLLAVVLFVAGTGWAAHQTIGAKPPESSEAGEKAPLQAAREEQPRINVPSDPLPPGAVARLGTIRFRHEEGHSWQFAVSPDGRTVATAAGRNLILWDMATGLPQRRFPQDQILRCLAFAPDGKSVVIGGEDCIAHRMDLASGKELQRFVGHQADNDPFGVFKGVQGVAFADTGRKLVTWGSDKTLRAWDAHSGKELRQLGSKDLDCKDWLIRGVSADGKLLAVSKLESQQTPLHLWNLETGEEVRQRTYPNAVGGVAFSPDGKVLAISDGDQIRPGRIVLWDLQSGKELAASPSRKGWVHSLAFSPDGKTLASAGFGMSRLGDRIHLWDVDSMKELRATPRLQGPVSAISQLAFSPDGRALISRTSENHIRLWDVASWKERVLAEGPNQAIRCLAYSPHGKLVASASADRIWLWSAATSKVVRILESPGAFVLAVTFSADGKAFVSANGDGTLQLWDLETGKEQRCIRTGEKYIRQMALTPDGKTIAVWGDDIPQTIFLWDAPSGEKRGSLNIPPENPGVRAALNALCFSSDGKTLYASSGTHTSILRWASASGKELPFLGKHDGGLNGIALSPDGRSIAALSLGGTLYLWEMATGQERLIIKDAGFATAVAFSSDGSLLALVNAGNHRLIDPVMKKAITQGVENREQVRLVRVADGKIIRRFTGHLGGINCVSFSPDGRTLASGGQDTTVLLWDVSQRNAEEGPVLLSEKLAALWAELRGTAAEAHCSMSALIASPAQTVPFLAERLKPVTAVDDARFAKLLRKLESEQFREREEATRELRKLGEAIEPAVHKALKENKPLETRRRLQALLDELGGSERLRVVRAMEVLERIGNRPARDLLRQLAEGAAGAWLTEEARASLRRLK